MLNIGKSGIISRTYRHLNRYRQILTVLLKYGFEELVDALNVEQYLEIVLRLIPRKKSAQVETLTRPERLRMALVELGPTFIKMGQILSTRADIIPAEFIEELSKLQDRVSPFPFIKATGIVEEEFGAPLNACFAHMEEVPIAAASLGQVHRARLHNGERVVVKVQRPGIRDVIKIDLEIMLHLASLMEKHLEDAQFHQPGRAVKEFSRVIEKELDYTIEATSMERFAQQFKDDESVYVPVVYRDMTTRRVLTMEYIDGIKASEIAKLEQSDLDQKEIASRGADLTMKQIFDFNFFHADPHPGNTMILPGNIVCYLDYGMMGRTDRETRDGFADLLAGIVKRDETAAAMALLKLTIWEEEPEERLLEVDMAEFIGRYFYRPLKEVEFAKLLQQLLKISSTHRLRLKPDLFLMLKVLSTVDGLGRVLDPEFDITKKAAPFIRRIQMERLDPRRAYGQIIEYGHEFLHLLRLLPGELQKILTQMRRGRIKIKFEHRGLEPMLVTLDQISNRIAFAIVLASLIIGSSLIVLSGIPPGWYGIPVIGLAGFVIAGVMGFWLLWSILRSRKM